jgi:DNA-binding NarL/FixJ family response regulator
MLTWSTWLPSWHKPRRACRERTTIVCKWDAGGPRICWRRPLIHDNPLPSVLQALKPNADTVLQALDRPPMKRTANCLLIEDHAIFRDALVLLLGFRQPGLALSTCGSLAEARDWLQAHPQVDLVLLDLHLPDSRGIDSVRTVRELAPSARVIVLSADERPATVLAALDAGAAGFIPKTAESSTLQTALLAVLDGKVYVPEELLTPAEEQEAVELTSRQLDVLRGVVDGQSNKVIARALEMSESTVKTHLRAVYQRLGISSRTQAILASARMGLLQDD